MRRPYTGRMAPAGFVDASGKQKERCTAQHTSAARPASPKQSDRSGHSPAQRAFLDVREKVNSWLTHRSTSAQRLSAYAQRRSISPLGDGWFLVATPVASAQIDGAPRPQPKHAAKKDASVEHDISAAWQKAQQDLEEYNALKQRYHSADGSEGTAVQDSTDQDDRILSQQDTPTVVSPESVQSQTFPMVGIEHNCSSMHQKPLADLHENH